MKVCDRQDRLRALGAEALFVVHDEPDTIRAQMLEGIDVPFPVLVDRTRDSYAAWGMTRSPWWRIWLDPIVWRTYARLLRSGERLRAGGSDSLQLGGDFLVAADGTLAYTRPQRRDDRPAVGDLLHRVRDLRD